MKGLFGWLVLGYLYYLTISGKLTAWLAVASQPHQTKASPAANATASTTGLGTLGGTAGAGISGLLSNPGGWLP